MDKVSPIVLDVILSSSESVPSVVNVVHPRPVSWHSLMSEISAALAGYGTLPLIPFNRWISDLEKKGMLNDEQVLEFVGHNSTVVESDLSVLACFEVARSSENLC